MFKLAAITAAVAAATPREEIENSMEMWNAKINEKDMHYIEQKANRLEWETERYINGREL